MRTLIILFTAISLLLSSSCGSVARPQPDELPSGGSESITTDETTKTKEPEPESTDDNTAEISTESESETSDTTTVSEVSDPIDNYDDSELQDIIDQSLDTLDADYIFTAEDRIAAHPEAFEAIVSLGKRAIPYLKKYTDANRELTFEEKEYIFMARTAAYAIDPSLFDLVFESPDKSTSLKLSVRSFGKYYDIEPAISYGKLSLITADPDKETELAEFDYVGADVLWSESGNYAVLTGVRNDRYIPSAASLIDISNQRIIDLPSLGIYNRIRKDEPELGMFRSFSVKSCDWNSENPTIGFEMEVGAAFYSRVIHGEYTFDIKTNEPINITYDPLPAKTPAADLTDEKIKKIVDENLDILTENSDEIFWENEVIAAHPEAFDAIVALGKPALKYLDETASGLKETRKPSSEYWRSCAAVCAAYVIDPEKYGEIYESPDGNYAVELNICSYEDYAYRRKQYLGANIIDNRTGEVITGTYMCFTDIGKVRWTPSGRFALIPYGFGRYGCDVAIFDTQTGDVFDSPFDEVMRQIIDIDDTVSVYGIWSSVESLNPDDTAAMSLFLAEDINFGKTVNVTYNYDLQNRTISEITYEIKISECR